MIHVHHGDILREETQVKFVQAIRMGLISGFVAGPPCETWSTAREHDLGIESGHHGPRPLRSVEFPEGLGSLKVRELRQVLIGNRLLGVAILLAYHIWAVGGFAVLEHPMLPVTPHSASIWRLAVVRLLCKQHDVAKIAIKQGLFGAKSSKPTDLLIIRPPHSYLQILDKHKTRTRERVSPWCTPLACRMTDPSTPLLSKCTPLRSALRWPSCGELTSWREIAHLRMTTLLSQTLRR